MSNLRFNIPLAEVSLKDCQDLLQAFKQTCLISENQAALWNEWSSFLEFDCNAEVLKKIQRAITADLEVNTLPDTPEILALKAQQQNILEHIHQQKANEAEQRNIHQEITTHQQELKELETRLQLLKNLQKNQPSTATASPEPEAMNVSLQQCQQSYRALLKTPADSEAWQTLFLALQTLKPDLTLLAHPQAARAQKAEQILEVQSTDLFSRAELLAREIEQLCPDFDSGARYYWLNTTLNPIKASLQQWQKQAEQPEKGFQEVTAQLNTLKSQNERLELLLHLLKLTHSLKRLYT